MSLRNISRLFVNQQTFGSVRLYSRWTHRKPAKVLLSFEETPKSDLKKENVIDLGTDILNKKKENTKVHVIEQNVEPRDTSSVIQKVKFKEIKCKKEEALKKRNFYLSQSKVFDDNNEILFEKLNENDSKISSLIIKAKSKKDRLRSGHMLVEGWRLIVDGLEAKCKLNYLVFSRLEDLNNLRPFLPKTGVKIYKVPYKDIELWSDVGTSPGIFGIFQLPKPENIKISSKPLPLHFICDNIRVPGNLGAILRAAVGVGCEKVLLTKGCVDLWDPKVIRSASGAHFRLPIHNSIDWEEIPKMLEKDTSVFIADSNTQVPEEESNESDIEVRYDMQLPVLPYFAYDFHSLKHITLILGGETEGISEESFRLAANNNGLRLNIPLQNGVDSLNTGMATAVIAFEIRKQILQAWSKQRLEKLHAT